MALGDYLQYQRENLAVSADGVITATAQGAATAITVKSANHRIYVQKVALSITTHAVGKDFQAFAHTTTSEVVARRIDLAAAAGVPDFILWDFGPKGFPLPLGESLDWSWSTGNSGFVGVVHIEGYMKLDATVALGTTN